MLNNIKKSLSFKISLLTIAIILCLGIIVMFFGIRTTINNISDYYETVSEVAISYTQHCSEEYFKENNLDGMMYLTNEFRKMCKEEIIDLILIIAQSKEDKNKGYIVTEINKDEIIMNDIINTTSLYDLEDYEKKILSGEKEGECNSYDSKRYGSITEIGKKFNCYVKNIDESFTMMTSVIVKKETIDNLLFSLLINYTIIIMVVICIVVIIFEIMLKRRVIKPIKEISNSMKNFIKDDKMEIKKLNVRGNDEIYQTAMAFNIMTEDINNYVKQVKEYESIQQKNSAELNIAFQIQKGLLPNEKYTNDLFNVNSFIKPAREVGGDFYFYEQIDENRLVIAIGDVSGKGITASMYMANVISAIKYNFRTCDNPSKVLEIINNDIVKNNSEQLFVTLFVGIVDAKTKMLTYSNAGHNVPYLIKNKVVPLNNGRGMCIGIFEDEKYENAQIEIEENDYIFMYTDGVTEAVNTKNELFGDARLISILEERENNFIDEVLSEIRKFAKDAIQNDDVTMLTVKFKSSNKLVLPAKIEFIKKLKDFIICNDKIKEDFKMKLFLVAEEVFVNICSYGYPNGKSGTVEINLTANEKCVIMKFVDDAIPFNPLKDIKDADLYDVDKEIGGLGRLIVSDIMDESEYNYLAGKNIFVLKKNLNR